MTNDENIAAFDALPVTRVDEITFHAPTKSNGSSMISINIDLNGRPYGQLWTFKEKDCQHPWHAKNLSGWHDIFNDKRSAMKAVQNRIAIGW